MGQSNKDVGQAKNKSRWISAFEPKNRIGSDRDADGKELFVWEGCENWMESAKYGAGAEKRETCKGKM